MSPVVYVVDDESICLQPMKALVTAFGYECRAFTDPEEMLSSVNREGEALILADMRMPHMNGLQLFRNLREAGIEFPFVLISGHADTETVDLAIESGVSEFLPKPFEPKDLQQVIERHLPNH